MKYFLLGVVIFSMGACGSSRIVAKPIPDNPTSYIFKGKINRSAKAFCDTMLHLSTEKFDVYEVWYNGDPWYNIWPDEAKKALAAPANKYDIWMYIKDTSDISVVSMLNK